jgi:hypothetical protein
MSKPLTWRSSFGWHYAETPHYRIRVEAAPPRAPAGYSHRVEVYPRLGKQCLAFAYTTSLLAARKWTARYLASAEAGLIGNVAGEVLS